MGGQVNPDLLIIKKVNELTDNSNPKYLLTAEENGDLIRTDYQILKSEMVSGSKGEATPTSSPTAWAPGDPDLFEKWDIKTAGTYTNFKDNSTPTPQPIVVSADDLKNNFVQIWVRNGVSSKTLSAKPLSDLKIPMFEDLNFPANEGQQTIYQDVIWQVKDGKTAISTDIPSYTSDIWVKVNNSDNWISKISENSVGNKTISTTIEKIIRNATYDQIFEIPPRIDGVLKSGQFIRPNGTIATSTGTRQTIELPLTAGVKAFFKGYNVGSGGTVPNAVFVNSNSVATVVLPGGTSTSVAEPYEGDYTPTVSGTLYINVDSRPEFINKYLYYNDLTGILTLSFRQKMLSANRLDLKSTSIAWCGDSITRYGLDQNYGKGFQLVIQESVKFKTSTTYATGGFTLADLNASSTTWVSHDIFSLLIGINDHRLATPLGVLADFDNNTNNGTFYAELRKYVNKVYSLNPSALIIMCTPTQVNTFPFTTTNPRNSFTKNAVNCDLNDYAEAIRTVSRKYSFPLADLFNDANQNIINIQQLTYEGVHQFSEGYRRLANIIMNAVNKVI